jgi:hypothetical protein
VAGAVTTGAWSPGTLTVITVLAEPVRELLAVNVTVCVPAAPVVGVHVSVPLKFPAAGVNVAPAGTPEAVSELIAFPSGSPAITLTVSGWFSATAAVGGAVTNGALSPSTGFVDLLLQAGRVAAIRTRISTQGVAIRGCIENPSAAEHEDEGYCQKATPLIRQEATTALQPPDLRLALETDAQAQSLGCVAQLIDTRNSGQLVKPYLTESPVSRRVSARLCAAGISPAPAL